MGLKVVAGRAKSGKSTYIYDEINNEIINNSNDNLILIVPEQMTYLSEYEFIDRINNPGIMDVEILSFKRLAYKVFEEVGGLKIQEINSYGKIMLLKQIFEENFDNLQVFKKASKQDGFLREFDQLISEFKQNHVSTEFLENIKKFKLDDGENQLLNRKLTDVIKIYNDLNNKTKNKFYDEEDKMDLFISAIEKSSYIKNSKIWIDGFDSFNGQRYDLIKELIKYAKEVTISLNIDANSLENLQSTDDWEAFKVPYDTYNLISQDFKDELSIIPTSYNKYNNEIEAIEKNMFSIISYQFKGKANNINIYSSMNPYTETEKTATKIISLVRDYNYRWKDICVAVGDMDSYGININKVFTQYEIPFFLDVKRDIMNNPLTKFILSLLDMFIFNFKHDSVFEYLKTGFTSLNYNEVSQLENFALQYGIEGYKWFKPFEFNADDIEYFEKLRLVFSKGLKDSRRSFLNLRSALDITLFIFEFLNNHKVQDKIEKQVGVFKKNEMFEKSSENAQVWNYVMDIFEQIILAGGDILITPIEYRKMIEAGFREIMISIIPPTLDKVTVGGIDRISFIKSRALFVMGANEGKLDSKKMEGGLLLDNERDTLINSGMKLLLNSKFNFYKEKHLLYKVFTSSMDKLYVSFALGTTDGKTLQPSMYIERLKQIFPTLSEETDLSCIEEIEKISNSKGTMDFLVSKIRDYIEGKKIDDIWKDVYVWYETNDNNACQLISKGISYDNKTEKINNKNLQKIHEIPVSMSVSKLESFAECPFKFFMENIIKPQPRIVQKVEFYDLGNIYHKAVEEFTNEIAVNKIDINKLDKNSIYVLAQSCTEKVLQEGKLDYTALDANERNKYMKEKIKRLVNRGAYTIIEQLKRGNFRPVYTELSIGKKGKTSIESVEIKISDEMSIYLQGRIDRVDVYNKEDKTYINIIDYKSSYKDIDFSDAIEGLQLQLLVYMSAVLKKGDKLMMSHPEIGGAYYFCIDDPMIDGDNLGDKNPEDEIFGKLSLKGIIVDDLEVISNMDNEIIEKKSSDIIPVSFNKDGSTSKKSHTLAKNQFQAILNKTDNIAREISGKILDGAIDINPYRKEAGNKTPCSYCNYTGICQFDVSVDGNKYRKIKKQTKDDILLQLMMEGGDSSDEMDS